MVLDVNGRSHKPKGLPQREAGTYETTTGGGDDDITPTGVENNPVPTAPSPRQRKRDRIREIRMLMDGEQGQPGGEWDMDVETTPLRPGANARRRHYYEWMDLTAKGWIWDENRLKASDDEDGHADREVLDPMGELELRDKAVGCSDSHPADGPVMRAFRPWFPNDVDCRMVAEAWVDTTLISLRRSCASDPRKCYSRTMVADRLFNKPIRVERILAREPWRFSAHRMRVGRPYLERIQQWKADHRGALPNAKERDRLWDENMAGYYESKRRPDGSTVTLGRGLSYSDGRSIDPNRSKIRRDRRTGEPLNGRKDFEIMLAQGRGILPRSGEPDFDTLMNRYASGENVEQQLERLFDTDAEGTLDRDRVRTGMGEAVG